MEIAYLALGSNIDDRMAFLEKAETMLKDNVDISISKASKIYETEPWPKEEGQFWFLNQVIEIETVLNPQELLKVTTEIENKIGRKESYEWGPREIDIDILMYDNQVIESENLEIPHRHMRDRKFVLVPLVEIAPNLIDPVSNKSFKEILELIKKSDTHKVTPFL